MGRADQDAFLHQLLSELPDTRPELPGPRTVLAKSQAPRSTPAKSPRSTHQLDAQPERTLRQRVADTYATRSFVRATVDAVDERTRAGARGPLPEKVLELTLTTDPLCDDAPVRCQSLYAGAAESRVSGRAYLRDEWQWCAVQAGDVVHLIGTWAWDQGMRTITLGTFGPASAPEQSHLLIHHPDVIVSASRLAGVTSCMRKPMLQERVRSPSDASYVAVLGTMVHGLLQACLLAGPAAPKDAEASPCTEAPSTWEQLGNFTHAVIAAEVERQLRLQRAALVLVETSTDKAREDLWAAVPNLVAFGRTYLARRDASDASGPWGPVEDPRTESVVHALIVRVLSAESDVVSPMYGLKGRMDLVVEAALRTDTGTTHALLPIEIKSGRVSTSMEHMAQTSLYTLLLADQYGMHVDAGLLLYAQAGTLRRIPRATKEVRNLILARNEMAAYRRTMAPLPALDAPAILPKATCDTESAPAPASPASSDSFAEFDEMALAALEPLEAPAPFLPPTIDSAYKCERCYARDACLLYRRAVEQVTDTDSPIAELYRAATQHLTHTDTAFFAQWDALLSHEERTLQQYQREMWTVSPSERVERGRCILDAQLERTDDEGCVFVVPSDAARLGTDDMVILAVHTPQPMFLTRGRIVRVSSARVHIHTEAPLAYMLAHARTWHGWSASQPLTFRLDADELMAMMGAPRYNLACLFYAQAPPRVQQLRERVVHLRAPTWTPLSEQGRVCLERYAHTCHPMQRAAVERALTAQDYTLILGMPGTGKSTTISVLVRILLELGKSVLLCSYTHSAVDTIVAKLLDVPVVRIGPYHRIHPRVQPCALERQVAADASAEALHAHVAAAPLVAATCLGTSDAALAHRSFDVCIVDEASQITLPTTLGPLRLCQRFVLVGDSHQLPPLVRDPDALAHGLATSLFERLSAAHPQAVTALCAQYRMNAAIMSLSNGLVYDGQLQCGSERVAQATLALRSTEAPEPWLAQALAPACPVVWVDTDATAAPERRQDGALDNEREAACVGAMVDALGQCGVELRDMGVLTPYRQQVACLRAVCACEVLTLDQAQGRDWPVVLVSLVRSNEAGVVGELLRDRRRVNVMLSRAKTKLLLVGSLRTMSSASSSAPMRFVASEVQAHHTVVAWAPSNEPVQAAACPTAKRARRAAPTGLVREVLEEHGHALP
ncbi:DNA helicase [Malassezia caprae]|uniref:DNA helicase n=1 Tax=Malassezia caprae TaxID=1381934 RepID=A0AAF0E817_9BASI|nr:DNA helicase [Malassezia caprae]